MRLSDIEAAIGAATVGSRHVHAAYSPCQGCVRRAARAVADLLGLELEEGR